MRVRETLQAADGGVHRYAADSYYGGGLWILLTAGLGEVLVAQGDISGAAEILRWIESHASPEGNLPEQVPCHLNVPELYGPWEKRWGPVASPLLWSHAAYLRLPRACSRFEETVSPDIPGGVVAGAVGGITPARVAAVRLACSLLSARNPIGRRDMVPDRSRVRSAWLLAAAGDPMRGTEHGTMVVIAPAMSHHRWRITCRYEWSRCSVESTWAATRELRWRTCAGYSQTLGYGDVKTYLQSGNAVFDCSPMSAKSAAEDIEREVMRHLGLQSTVVIRTAEELTAAMAADPLRDIATDGSKHLVGFLAGEVGNGGREAFANLHADPEQVRLLGRHVYLWCPNGVLESAFSSVDWTKTLGTQVTMRNWNTVTKVAALAGT